MWRVLRTYFTPCILIVAILQIDSLFYDAGIQLTDAVDSVATQVVPKSAEAAGQHGPTGGLLQTGTEQAVSVNNIPSWRGTVGNDGNYWDTARTASGLSKILYFDGVELRGANKMIVTVEDSNITTGNAYSHLICDWVSTTDVFLAADANCTGGGWRHLHPLRTDNTNTTDTLRQYEIYDGYFWTTGNVRVATPISNFISSSGRVMVRTYSTVNSAVRHQTDYAQVEMAIDPIYEPADFATTSAGVITNGVRHLVGAPYTTLTPADNVRMTIPMPAINNPVDMYFTFKNVRTYEGMNTVLLSSELCVSNAALTFAFYLYNFTSNAWDRGTATTTGSVCGTDTDYAFAMSSSTISGFDIENYVDSGGDLRVRLLTASPGVVYSAQIDRLYMMLGSANSDTGLCEISWGSGTASNCTNTRSIGEAVTGTPAATWQVTSATEYGATNQHALDNDDDGVNAEHAFASNISFPIKPPRGSTVTGIHYANKFRSGTTTMTLDTQLRNYGSTTNTAGVAMGGWMTTPGIDTSASATYVYYDSWRLSEIQNDAHQYVHHSLGRGNMRLRTSLSTNTIAPVTFDWSFALMSIRWIEEGRHTSVTGAYGITSGTRVTGTSPTQDNTNLPTWRGALGNDGNYWATTRTTTGFDKLLYFGDVRQQGANKIIISIEDTNVTTGNAYEHLICDWVSGVDAYLAADANCPGGWRSLHPLRSTYTNITDTLREYEIYDGYFWTTGNVRVATPISNFISSTTQQVLVRARSTVNSSVVYRIDWAVVEMAIDPVYEPATFATTSVGAVTNGVRHLIGTFTTGVNGSDGTKMTLPMPAINTPVDVEFGFKNVKPFGGANTIHFLPEVCATNAALTFAFYVYNYTTALWERGSPTTTPSVCGTDTNYGFSFNSTSISGFSMSDYVENGNVRVRLLTAAPGVVYNLQLDQMYMMVGSVNTDTALCEISFGTGTASNCSNTRTMAEGITATPSTATWQITSAIEYQGSQYATDNDDDANANEFAKAANLSFPVTVATGTAVTGIHYAAKFRSNATSETWAPQIRNYSALTGIGNELAGSGWVSTPGTDTNALTTYSYFDSYRIMELQNAPDDSIDYTDNRMNMRMHTAASSNVAAGVQGDLDFAMMAVRYLESRDEQALTFSLSDNSVGFGALSAMAPRYATGNGVGSGSVSIAHNLFVRTNAAGGYAVSISGSTLTCCTNFEIDPIGSTATTSQTGTEQFGLSLELLSGAGTVLSPYNGSTTLFALATSSFPDEIANGLGTGLYDTYAARYIANINPQTLPGTYTAILNYIVTSTY
jgi:hypothetical protein